MTRKQIDKYFLMRKRKRITLKEIAAHIDCSISLISKFELGRHSMNEQKIIKYKQFIDAY
ncbi:helix-turn-helix domain-containing protein [Jeotgalibacillus malaysiensis]|uniref:helix-turn-helix domain-containing protein n=1 Tax=Jeotgalibacillus malaysiensis TaxID=1508404 RepID=UPI00384E5DFB